MDLSAEWILSNCLALVQVRGSELCALALHFGFSENFLHCAFDGARVCSGILSLIFLLSKPSCDAGMPR